MNRKNVIFWSVLVSALVVIPGMCFAQEQKAISYTVTCSGSGQKSVVYTNDKDAKDYFAKCKMGVYYTPRFYYDLTKSSSSASRASSSASSILSASSQWSSSIAARPNTGIWGVPLNRTDGTPAQIVEYRITRGTTQIKVAGTETSYAFQTPVNPGELITIAALDKNGIWSDEVKFQ